MNKNTVYIYRDEGVDAFSVSCLYSETSKELKRTGLKIRFISAEEIIGGKLQDAVALFMAGGRDVPYAEKLNGNGNNAIRSFIEGGGSYLGVCAGAYYACKTIEYKKDSSDAIIEQRDLCLFDGTARGPLNNLANEVKADIFPASAVCLELDANKQAVSYYQEGPEFIANNNNKYDVLASYYHNGRKTSPAVIVSKFGKGTVVLSGVHPEVTGESFASNFAYYYSNRKMPKEFIKFLKQNEVLRKKLWLSILKTANLKTLKLPKTITNER